MYHNFEARAGWKVWAVILLLSVAAWGGIGFIVSVLTGSSEGEPEPAVQLSAMTIDANQIIQCEFDKPITNILSIVRWYDDYETLNDEYHEYMQEWYTQEDLDEMGYDPENEIWGWSNCEWQPENDIAFCDVYTVLPTVMIEGEMSAEFDTFGHEVFHGACGDFHD